MTDSSPQYQLVVRGVTFVPPDKAWVQVHAVPSMFSVGSALVLSTAKSKMSATVERVSQASDLIVKGALTNRSDVLIAFGTSVDAVELSSARELSSPSDFRNAPDWAECQRTRILAYQVESNQKRELERLRKQLICNLEVLCVRGNPRQFEELMAELFSRLGYQVYLTAQSNDGGKDIVCKLNNSTTYVECKFFSPGQKVGRPHLQKLAGAMAADRVTEGKCVTTGAFTQQAAAYAKRVGIELWDIDVLSNLIAEKFPEKRMPLTYNELCHACGAAVEFELFNPVHAKKCPNNHEVQKTIFGKDALPDFLKNQWGSAR